MKRLSVVISLVGWFLAIAWVLFFWLAPSSWWVSDAEIDISDSVVGGASPTININLTYEKTIMIHWTRILHKQSDDDEWFPACDIEAAGMVYSGVRTIKTTIDDLFEGRPCARNLASGDYYVEADLEWTDGAQRSVSIESNIFTISAMPGPGLRRPHLPSSGPVPEVRRYHRHLGSRMLPWPFSLFTRH